MQLFGCAFRNAIAVGLVYPLGSDSERPIMSLYSDVPGSIPVLHHILAFEVLSSKLLSEVTCKIDTIRRRKVRKNALGCNEYKGLCASGESFWMFGGGEINALAGRT